MTELKTAPPFHLFGGAVFWARLYGACKIMTSYSTRDAGG